ncbi:MAG: peptidylprolyl isomerase [Acutalibacteraceae bacterium]
MFKKIIAGMLSVLMLISLVSCSNTDWVIEEGDITISSGVYLGYLINATLEALSSNSAESVKDLMKLTIENKSADEYIKENALNYCKTHIAIEKKFKELGLTLSEETENSIDSDLARYLAYYSAYYEENGCGEKSLRAIIESNYMLDELFMYYYGEGGEKEVSKDELTKYLVENYARVQYISVPLTDTSTYEALEGEELDNAKDKAHSYLDRANDGEDFEALVKEYAASVSGEEEDEETDEDEDTVQENGLGKNDSFISKNNSQYEEEFINGVFEMSVGDYKLITTDNYCYVVKKLDVNESEKTLEYYKETLLSGLKGDEFTETYTSWKDTGTYSVNNAAVSKYKPKKLSFDLGY